VVIDATETGELLPLARVPYRLGTDGESRWEPSSKPYRDPYCTQGFTYTFVMERSAVPQVGVKASGGIRTVAQAEAMIAAGASRIGTSWGAGADARAGG